MSPGIAVGIPNSDEASLPVALDSGEQALRISHGAASLNHTNPRLTRNNFDLLRLLFAATVCLVHAGRLSGLEQLGWIGRLLSSETAVKAFFVVSGFLIFMSFERSTSLASYAGKRVRRIYPAYFVVVLLCATGLLAVSSRSIGDYFSLAWFKYVVANLAFLNFLQQELPGVFESNNVATVNGALWTLKIEVMFYVAVPLLVWLFRRFGHFPMLALVYCASVLYATLMAAAANRTGSGLYAELGRQLPGQLCYFVSGAFFYYYLPLFERRAGYFLAAAFLLLAGNMLLPLPLLEPFALSAVVIFFGLFLHVGNFGRFGDFSYGIYILHFPIIQLLLQVDWFHENPWMFLLAVVSTTLVAAVAMWHLVEKRFLFRSSHYIGETPSHGAGVPDPAATVGIVR
jgi:peptidoglycan/LPS O-acetylase OafA/YrhL